MNKNFSRALLILILLFSAFLRLYKIADYMTFLGDEGRDVLIVYNILHGHPTLLGPTASVGGFFLGPAYYYFMAPFLWLFNYDPVGPAVMVAIFGVLTVWFVYKLGSEFFSEGIGLTSAFLYSIAPVVIAYSRSSWNPNLMPFFTLFTLFCLYKAEAKNSKALFVLSGLLLGILMQLHYLATFVGGIIFIYVLFAQTFKRNEFGESIFSLIFKSLSDYFFIFLGFIVGFSPFLTFEARHGFLNIKSIIAFIFHSKGVQSGGNFFVIVNDVFYRLFGRLVTDFPPPEQVSVRAHHDLMVWYILTFILALASSLYFLKVFINSKNERLDFFLKNSLIFCWFAVGILLFGFYKKQIYDYYFGFLFPVPFLLVAVFLDFLWSKGILKILAVLIFLALAYINLQAIPFRFTPNRQLEQTRDIAKFVLQKTNNKPFNFALITGGNSDHAYRYFFTILNHSPVTILNVDTDPKRTSVTDQLLVICEMQPCAPLGNSLWEIAGFGRADITGQWDVSVVKVFRLIHYKGV